MRFWKQKYFWQVLAIAFLAVPLIVYLTAVAVLIAMTIVRAGDVVVLLILALGVVGGNWLLWGYVAGRDDLPEGMAERYAPIAVAFGWCMLILTLSYFYRMAQPEIAGIGLMDGLALFPWYPLRLLFDLTDDAVVLPIVLTALYGLAALCLGLNGWRLKRQEVQRKRGFVLLGVVVLIGAVCLYQANVVSSRPHFISENVLEANDHVEQVADEVQLWKYDPFAEGNLLQKPAQAPSLAIEDGHPRLDGATAAYPVYGAMVQALYKGLDKTTVGDYVACSKTEEAYQRLMDGEVDIFFGAQPSEWQMQEARSRGLTFQLIPIAKEAFVFFVNTANPIEMLSVAQIQDIYQKKVVNWKELGGKDQDILPFQRPENSGSQTIMEKMMAGKPLAEPVQEEMADGMGMIIREVGAYRNYLGAIGYSFRYFATGMKPNRGIRLLAVEGVPPSVDNIRSGAYPFTVDVYAVVTREPEGNVKKLLDWVVSPEGQQLIEQCGYVGI